jgi:hypothetical protein
MNLSAAIVVLTGATGATARRLAGGGSFLVRRAVLALPLDAAGTRPLLAYGAGPRSAIGLHWTVSATLRLLNMSSVQVIRRRRGP